MSTETALTPRDETQPSLLIGAPSERLAQATEIANALAQVVNNQHLYVDIKERQHVLYEGWTTLGALVGVFPVTVWTHELADGWEARVEARTLSGAVVGAAEAECRRSEATWHSRDSYALRSMAQTRAGSKALRMPLGFIVALAGFDATPAEEMGHEPVASQARRPAPTRRPVSVPATGTPATPGPDLTRVPDWTGFWVVSAEQGLRSQKEAHALFGVQPEQGALRLYAEARAAQQHQPLWVIVDAMKAELPQLVDVAKAGVPEQEEP